MRGPLIDNLYGIAGLVIIFSVFGIIWHFVKQLPFVSYTISLVAKTGKILGIIFGLLLFIIFVTIAIVAVITLIR